MKKLVLSLILLAFVCCGCTSVSTNVKINNDKSASVSNELKFDGNFSNPRDLEAIFIKKNYKQFVDDDYEVTQNNSTIKAEKSVKNLENNDLDLSSLGFVSNLPSGRFVEFRKNFFVTSYNIDMTYNLKKVHENFKSSPTDVAAENTGLKPEYLQEYADRSSIVSQNDDRADFIANYENNLYANSENVEVKEPDFNIEDLNVSFSVELPALASYNNADNVNGNVYTWDIRKTTPTVIKLQYVIYSGSAIGFLFILGIGLLVYIARRILRHDELKRVGENN